MPQPLITTIMPTLDDSMILGDPRSGKTRAAIHEMCCFLAHRFLPQPPKVYGAFDLDPESDLRLLFLSAETPKREIQMFIQASLRALGLPRTREREFRSHLLSHFQWFSKEDGCFQWFLNHEYLIEVIKHLDFRPDLVYVDALTDIWPGAERPDREAELINVLRTVAQVSGGFVWRIIHHRNAAGGLAGGFPLKAWARHRLTWDQKAFNAEEGISEFAVTTESHWSGTKTFASTMTVTGPTLKPTTISYRTVASLPERKDTSKGKGSPRQFTRQGKRVAGAIDRGHGTIKKLAATLHLTEKRVRDIINAELVSSNQFEATKVGKAYHYSRVAKYKLAVDG